MREEWRPTVGFNGYEVSSRGRVRAVARTVERISRTGKTTHFYPVSAKVLHPTLRSDGYLVVTLCFESNRSGRQIQRLVADAFLGPIPAGCEVDHINFDRTDNRVENLRIVDPRENVAHTVRAERHRFGARHYISKLTPEAVRDIRANYSRYKVTLGHFCRKYGVTEVTVYNAFIGKTWASVK